jgi:hypothetical protein
MMKNTYQSFIVGLNACAGLRGQCTANDASTAGFATNAQPSAHYSPDAFRERETAHSTNEVLYETH